jgi:hypothetical protein
MVNEYGVKLSGKQEYNAFSNLSRIAVQYGPYLASSKKSVGHVNIFAIIFSLISLFLEFRDRQVVSAKIRISDTIRPVDDAII